MDCVDLGVLGWGLVGGGSKRELWFDFRMYLRGCQVVDGGV